MIQARVRGTIGKGTLFAANWDEKRGLKPELANKTARRAIFSFPPMHQSAFPSPASMWSPASERL